MSFVCRSCSGKYFDQVIDLGEMPLANALLTAENLTAPEAHYPLCVVHCKDCNLVQITETVAPDILFSNYVYFSSFSDTVVAAAKALAERLMRERGLGTSSLVMEAASNDGYLLQHYHRCGIPVIGIEPAANIAKHANSLGIRTRAEFFNVKQARKLADSGFACDVFHANNVLAHVADLNDFVAGIATILKPGGVASIEVPYLCDLIEKTEFDTIYHEHLCYFSVTALDALLVRNGLILADIERIPIHGGSLRLFVTQAGGRRGNSVEALIVEESRLGIQRPEYYEKFCGRVERLKQELLELLHRLKTDGHKLAAYGASAKGSTLLNYFGIGRELLDYVVDRSTVKVGKYTPGSHLPVVLPQELNRRKPDYILLLTWNFAGEILGQLADYRRAGGKFILPIPSVQIV